MEIVLTFFLVFSVYATIKDPNRSTPDGLGPLLIGLLICPISLAGGAFSGASMNPAGSFGPALTSGNWTGHWVYWAGPIVGSVFAVLICENFFIVHNQNHISLKKKVESL
ncbi:Aquaporin TIP4-1 [Platanthera zijinensis]|uniref:Aquaporin TIP4-1 n=1 Tax=Platanthera zijinensis TaxID=2320716 RepID=A0AAP0C0N7_9ASPA